MNREVVIVDLFAGGGGASNGAKSAIELLNLVVKQFVAVNHWKAAILTHEANHPDATHYHCAVEEVDPRKAITGNIIDLLIAGPSCTTHSNAKGGQSRDEQSRTSPWSILNWLKDLWVRAGVIENVPEFQKWGPLDQNGHPIKSKEGQTFNAFIEALKSHGYKVEYRVLNAADYGDATGRRRLFILFRRVGTGPIKWPEPTNIKPLQPKKNQLSLFQPVKPVWRVTREILNFDIPMGPETSIFNREAYGKKPLQPNTMRRIFVGLFKYGLKDFVLGQQSGATPRGLDFPLPTVSGAGAISLVSSLELPYDLFSPYLVKLRGTNNAVGVDEPTPSITTSGTHLYLAQPADPYIVQFDHGGGGDGMTRSVDMPLGAVVTKQNMALAQPYIVSSDHSGPNFRGQSLEMPLPTIAGGGGFGLASPYLIKYYGTGENLQSMDEPLGAVTTRERFALCVPLMQGYLLLDIRYRMLHYSELAAAMSFPKSYIWLNAKKKPASNKDITRMIGNAWPNRTGQWLCYSQLQ